MAGYRGQVDNIRKGADAATGANKARAQAGAASRASAVGDAMFDAAAPVLLRPEILDSLPADLASRIRLGDPQAVLEGIMHVGRSGKIPQNLPKDTQLARNNFPDADAGFQRGAYGGRVPTDSAGELIPAGSRLLARNPGAEAGFQMGGSIPPQDFPSSALTVQRGGAISVPPRQASGKGGGIPIGPLVGGGIAAGAVGKSIYDAFRTASEEAVPETSEAGTLPDVQQPVSEIQSLASKILDEMQGASAKPTSRKPPRPESQLWSTQGERSMEYELRPGSPQARTRDVLLDAGIEPERAEGIARGIVSMTEMERRAVIENGPARMQRSEDEIRNRRNARMRGY